MLPLESKVTQATSLMALKALQLPVPPPGVEVALGGRVAVGSADCSVGTTSVGARVVLVGLGDGVSVTGSGPPPPGEQARAATNSIKTTLITRRLVIQASLPMWVYFTQSWRARKHP